jgi:hypothetical protein
MLKASNQPLIEPWHPTADQEQAMQASEATSAWLSHLPPDILRKYQDQWIAAKDCAIIAAGQTMEELLAKIGTVDLQTVVVMCLRRPVRVIQR